MFPPISKRNCLCRRAALRDPRLKRRIIHEHKHLNSPNVHESQCLFTHEFSTSKRAVMSLAFISPFSCMAMETLAWSGAWTLMTPSRRSVTWRQHTWREHPARGTFSLRTPNTDLISVFVFLSVPPPQEFPFAFLGHRRFLSCGGFVHLSDVRNQETRHLRTWRTSVSCDIVTFCRRVTRVWEWAHGPQQVLMFDEQSHEMSWTHGSLHLLLSGVLPAEDEEIGRYDHRNIPQTHSVLLFKRHHLTEKLQKSLWTYNIQNHHGWSV